MISSIIMAKLRSLILHAQYNNNEDLEHVPGIYIDVINKS